MNGAERVGGVGSNDEVLGARDALSEEGKWDEV